MPGSRVKINVAASVMQQVVSIICAFILPRVILRAYGSAYNGVVNSVTQFLSCVTLLRAGIGGVTRAALYKSLASGDLYKTSAIVKATESFMRKIALGFSVLLVVFAAVYPFLVREEFGWFFSFSLVLVLGISTVVQYYFGITNQILLHADQKLYVYNIWQVVATIANTVLSVGLITAGAGIHAAKLGSAAAFSITPIALHCYVKKKYCLCENACPDNTAIRQRWDAAVHQLAAFIHSNTDIMVLTVFADMLHVSVYSVYALIVGGINQLITSVSNAIEALLGKIMAERDRASLVDTVELYEWSIHIVGVILFGCASVLIVPFVMLYTKDVTDANYNQPLLGVLMCAAYLISAVRLPYQNVIEAAGHFSQTKRMAIVEAIINVIVSCSLAGRFGAVGVMLGTVAAMGYRTVCYVLYASKKLLEMPFGRFGKRILISAVLFGGINFAYFYSGIGSTVLLKAESFEVWVLIAIITAAIISVAVVLANTVFYPKMMLKLFECAKARAVRK